MMLKVLIVVLVLVSKDVQCLTKTHSNKFNEIIFQQEKQMLPYLDSFKELMKGFCLYQKSFCQFLIRILVGILNRNIYFTSFLFSYSKGNNDLNVLVYFNSILFNSLFHYEVNKMKINKFAKGEKIKTLIHTNKYSQVILKNVLTLI